MLRHLENWNCDDWAWFALWCDRVAAFSLHTFVMYQIESKYTECDFFVEVLGLDPISRTCCSRRWWLTNKNAPQPYSDKWNNMFFWETWRFIEPEVNIIWFVEMDLREFALVNVLRRARYVMLHLHQPDEFLFYLFYIIAWSFIRSRWELTPPTYWSGNHEETYRNVSVFALAGEQSVRSELFVTLCHHQLSLWLLCAKIATHAFLTTVRLL